MWNTDTPDTQTPALTCDVTMKSAHCWLAHPVPDKREAQMIAIEACPQATIHMTLDSDVELGSPLTIERGLGPFTRKRVMSVCGFLLGRNHSTNLLTKLVDLGFVTAYTNGRAAQSMFSSVTVNSGGLSLVPGIRHARTRRALSRPPHVRSEDHQR